ncbi:hypothetical protein RclHR1_16310005 [Rhizophagus clarus]|uniref:Uncharacterized protein n=1 Tax=Rhizophagus clarus TaxID=94130 RepID=A0A2Z6QIV7_9GLOM|nr:hypothetical protein RclHR1_16310005 [Rhizophagus clarus]GES86154.1 hypothetical protein RCL_jg18287.t1 [Rhizophagus clarus]
MIRNASLILVLLSILALFTVTGLANPVTFQSNAPETQELCETSTLIFDHGFLPDEKSQYQMEIPQYYIFDIHTCIKNCFKYSRDCITFKRCIKRCIADC